MLYLGEMIKPKVSQCKYLGAIVLDHNCDVDLKRQLKKIYINAYMLIKKLVDVSVNIKCNLFKMYCSTTYCSAKWYHTTKSAKK